MSDKALLQKVWELWTTGKRPEIPAAVEAAGDPAKVLTSYLALQRDLYWEKTCLEASLAVSRWGLAFARAKELK
ncbi:MAG: hypothetical protein MUC63_07910, partial [Planctomycetes bacterium]|nr:hypothetical protein [Planctomycetota bacterium]